VSDLCFEANNLAMAKDYSIRLKESLFRSRGSQDSTPSLSARTLCFKKGNQEMGWPKGEPSRSNHGFSQSRIE
jgi:hypothetical protein